MKSWFTLRGTWKAVTSLLILCLFLISCKKKLQVEITVQKDNALLAVVEIDGTEYKFNDNEFKKVIEVEDFETFIWVEYDISSDELIQVFAKGEGIDGENSGVGWCAMTVNNKRAKAGAKGYNSGASSHYCGHPTKDGTPCRRKVSGTSGYCWQHR